MSRRAAYPIMDLILNRWSPRAMSGELLSHEQVMTLFEAARFAPSSYNNQPWHFIYAYRETPSWQRFFDLLVPFNQSWAKNAAVLVVLLSRKLFFATNKPSRTHTFDTGAAWENLALQGYHDGLVIHGMEGFDYERTYKELSIPQEYAVEMMFAIGKPALPTTLPKELQEREKPSDRIPIAQFISEGIFKKVR